MFNWEKLVDLENQLLSVLIIERVISLQLFSSNFEPDLRKEIFFALSGTWGSSPLLNKIFIENILYTVATALTFLPRLLTKFSP